MFAPTSTDSIRVRPGQPWAVGLLSAESALAGPQVLVTDKDLDLPGRSTTATTEGPATCAHRSRLSWALRVATGTGPSEVGLGPLIGNMTEDCTTDLGMLAVAAEQGRDSAFEEAANQISWWTRPASDFVTAVHLALKAGSHLAARGLAARGARLYPDHGELNRMALVLAPPSVIRVPRSNHLNLAANLKWLRTESAGLKGQWVALDGGKLLASASSAEQLKAKVEDTRGLMITRVS